MVKKNSFIRFEKQLLRQLSKYISSSDTLAIEFDVIRFKKLLKYNKNQIEFLNFFLRVFKKLLKKKGTMLIPSFSYSWGSEKKIKFYDKKISTVETGIFPNFLLNKKDILRTNDPMFSFLIFGKKRKFYNSNNSDSFGKKSVYEKILKDNGKLISFGLPKFDPTFVHYVEQYFDENIKKINYIKKIVFTGFKVNSKGKKEKRKQICMMRPKKSNITFSEKKIIKILEKKKQIKKIRFLEGLIQIVDARIFFNIGINEMKKNIKFFTKKIN